VRSSVSSDHKIRGCSPNGTTTGGEMAFGPNSQDPSSIIAAVRGQPQNSVAGRAIADRA
jgi:hypothetical protein